jgi:hypothetical protein
VERLCGSTSYYYSVPGWSHCALQFARSEDVLLIAKQKEWNGICSSDLPTIV